jgi:hypothetical protein
MTPQQTHLTKRSPLDELCRALEIEHEDNRRLRPGCHEDCREYSEPFLSDQRLPVALGFRGRRSTLPADEFCVTPPNWMQLQ